MAELGALQASLSSFEDLGATLVGICPQLSAHSAELKARLGLTFELLHDADNEIAEAYGLALDTPPEVIEVERRLGLDLPAVNGTGNWRLPMPARVCVDRGGVIRSIVVQTDHSLRPEPEATLVALRNQGHSGHSPR